MEASQNTFARSYVGRMPHEELIERANAVRGLQDHPGWAFVHEVLEAQAEAAVRAAHRSTSGNPGALAAQIAGDPLKVAVRLAEAGGQVKALGSLASIVETIVSYADQVQAQIERETDVIRG